MNTFTVIFSPSALDDIRQAISYYEEQQEGLGERFSKALQSTLTSIHRNPFFASVRYDDIRCAQLRKFPYLIHYHINNDRSVYILAVYSCYRKPLWEE